MPLAPSPLVAVMLMLAGVVYWHVCVDEDGSRLPQDLRVSVVTFVQLAQTPSFVISGHVQLPVEQWNVGFKEMPSIPLTIADCMSTPAIIAIGFS